MKLIFRLAFMLLVMGMFAGCTSPGSIVPNATTAGELVKKLGAPTHKRSHPQGGEYWEYVYGPQGTETWRYHIDRGQMVRSATQLLTQERLYRVVPGVTTEAQVRELLGEPRYITRFSEETAWDWRVELTPARGLFIVRFDRNGVATGINIIMDTSPDSRDRSDRGGGRGGGGRGK